MIGIGGDVNMSIQELSRSVGVVQAECGSRYVCFLSQFFAFFLIFTFKNDILNTKKVYLIHDIHHRSLDTLRNTTNSF